MLGGIFFRIRSIIMSDKKIRPFIGTDLVKVMTGIRRCGKSVMLELIQEELKERGISEDNFISFNFEDMRNTHLCTAETLHEEVLNRVQGITGKTYLFFDEIQEVAQWEKCINSFRVEFDCDIYITGSNAKLLSGELTTVLGGRYVEFTIYPFSFAEFKELYSSVFPDVSDTAAFQKYLILGGMPYLGNLRYMEEPAKQYLKDIYNSVVLTDVVRRNKIRDIDLLGRIVAYVIGNVGTTFSANSIVEFLKSEHRAVAADTVMNYIKYCTNAYLFYQVKRQNLQGKQILATNEKYYMADHGIREAVFGGNMKDINLILENIIFMESLRRGYSVTVGKVGTKEIDFVCQKQEQKIYIQVAYLLASEETIQRESGVYDSVRDNYPKYVVTMDEIDMSQNGIKHKNIREFLTMTEW